MQRRMENYYFLSTLSKKLSIRRKSKCFSTSENGYRFCLLKREKKRIVYESVRWVPENCWCVDESGGIVGSANDVICVVTNTCGGRKVIFAASVYESGSIRVARLPTFQRVVRTRRPQGMPILRQVSWRSFTRGNAFLKDSLHISSSSDRVDLMLL